MTAGGHTRGLQSARNASPPSQATVAVSTEILNTGQQRRAVHVSQELFAVGSTAPLASLASEVSLEAGTRILGVRTAAIVRGLSTPHPPPTWFVSWAKSAAANDDSQASARVPESTEQHDSIHAKEGADLETPP